MLFLQAGELVHTTGDTHVYLNHIEPLEEQLRRVPKPFPTLHFKRNVQTIDEFQFEDFEIRGYDPYPTIKMEMAV